MARFRPALVNMCVKMCEVTGWNRCIIMSTSGRHTDTGP
jgi:hypothetical protein